MAPLLQRLGFKGPSVNEPVRNLSGGNQQKVVLAKWLATGPTVLLLDEPTRGIDVRAKGDFHQCIRELAAQGMGILFASSEIPEVMSLAHRIIVLSEGVAAGEFTPESSTPDQLLTAALPRTVSRGRPGMKRFSFASATRFQLAAIASAALPVALRLREATALPQVSDRGQRA